MKKTIYHKVKRIDGKDRYACNQACIVSKEKLVRENKK